MNRKKEYKKTLDQNDLLAKRRENFHELRREKRDKALSKRRKGNEDLDDQSEKKASAEELAELVHSLQTGPPSRQTTSLKQIRRLLSSSVEPPISDFLRLGLVPLLLRFIAEPHAENRLEAAWCITNIATGTHEETAQVVCTAPYLISFLGGNDVVLQEQCAWALGNIAGDSEELRDTIQANGVVRPLTQLLRSKVPSAVWTAAWALSNVIKGPHAHLEEFFDCGTVDVVLSLLAHSTDTKCLTEAAYVVAYLAAHDDHFLRLLDAKGAISILAQRLGTFSTELLVPVLRAIGNVASGPNDLVDSLLHQPLLVDCLRTFLQSEIRSLKKEAAWTTSNVAGSLPSHVDQLVHHGFVPVLIHLISTSQYDIKKEAAFALSNIAADGRYCELLVSAGAVGPFLSLLPVSDPDTASICLNFIGLVLEKHPQGVHLVEELNGIEALESLQFNENPDLRARATSLVDKFYGESYMEGAGAGAGASG
mmetsp:Transcript_35365/g.59088  ORF Transcript_35365/g.59088 Transcript_35365/m.59088 type:complete len:480 (-) Transcript_35365:1251-2690(-)